jgi:DNA mismatch repair ATPase MutL
MAKLSKDQIEALAGLSITAKDEAAAKKAVLKFLKENEITDVENESLDDLLEMAAAFAPEETDEVEDSEGTSDEELDEAASDEEDEEEEALPPSKGKGKAAAKPVAKPAAKAAAKPVAKKESKKVTKIDPANNKKDRAHYDFLAAKMPEGEKFEYNWLTGGGLAVKFVGNNAKKSLISFEPSLRDGVLTGNLIFNIWKKNPKRLKELIGDDFEFSNTWSGNIFIANATSKDYEKILAKKGFMTEMLAMVEKSDEKLGKNRDKMEAGLKGKSTTKEVAPAKPVAKAAPAKTVTKAAPAKAVAKPATKAAVAKPVAKKK